MQDITSHVRIPPQDIDSEKALLGAIMLKANAMYDVADTVVTDSFYASKHASIYDAMHTLFTKGEPIDIVSLAAKLKEQKMLDKVGGRKYLTELVNEAPSATNVLHYAQTVKTKHTLRELIDAANHIGELGYAEDRDIENIVDEAQAKVFEIANTSTLQKFTEMNEAVKEAFERLDALKENNNELRGVRSGFKNLDNKLAGFQKSDLIILAARPSMGKTSLALDIARQAAVEHGTSVGLFSLEMSSQQLVDRMLAAQANVDAWKLRTGKISDDAEYDRLRDGMAKLSEAPIYMDDKAGNTVLQMRSIARRLKTEKGLGMIIIDYLQLISPSAALMSASPVQQISEISRALKGMARELDVPVIALSQLSRAVEQRGGQPRLSDLRDSGSIEQDADVVIFIDREKKMQNEDDDFSTNGHDDFDDGPTDATIIIAKHRNGPIGEITLAFDADKASFKYLPRDTSQYGGPIEETSVDF